MNQPIKTPHPTLAMFQPDTMPSEAAVLMGAALIGLALSAPGLYVTTPSVLGGPATLNLDAMVRDAGNVAVQLQREIDKRTPSSGLEA